MKYGATGAMWAPFSDNAEEKKNEMPLYGTALSLDGVNEVTDSLTFADASAFGDNIKKIYVKDFTGGSMTSKYVWLPVSTLAKIFGTDADEAEGQSYGGEDEPPYGAFGFISNRMNANKKKFYEVVFYPKVQGSPDNSTYKTKEDNITMEYDSIPFAIFQAECGKYKVEKRFDTEAEAETYLKGLFAGTSAVPGVDAASA